VNVPFYFERSEYYNFPQTSMIVGVGASLTDRIMFNHNSGININISFVIPMFMAATIKYPDYEIFESGYDFLSYITSLGIGYTYRANNFNFDTGLHIHYFSMKNIFSEYNNFTFGFYVAPAYLMPIPGYNKTEYFEIGIKFGLDLFSNSKINLLTEKETLKYKGGYNMFSFCLYFGISI